MAKTKARKGQITKENKHSNKIVSNKVGAVQGDVPILRLAALPAGTKPTQTRIVAYGETTGHHHEVVGVCERYEVETTLAGQLFKGLAVVVTDGHPVRLHHNSDGDHADIELLPGVHFIPATGFQQVEYDGADERRVMD